MTRCVLGGATLPLDVLVVDDEEEIRTMLQTFLSSIGCRVAVAATGLQALRLLDQCVFHVAIVDLLLPDMGGMALAAQIRERNRELAIIILTGNPRWQSAADSLRVSAYAYLEKPVDLGRLRQDLEQIARQRGLLQNVEAEVLQSLGQKIHDRRRELGMRLRELSQLTSISVSMLSQIERAATSMSITNLVRIAIALQVDVRDLFGPQKSWP